MRCSVIIPVHNRASLTRQCLETILADLSFGARYEIVVVDDGSTDETPELLADFDDRIRLVRHDRPTGFAAACNDGAGAATGEDFVFLNNDTLPTEGWLDSLADYADSHPKAAVIGAKLLFPNDTIQHAGVTITEDLNPRHIYSGFPADHPAVNKSRRFPIVTAACAMFRRRPFEAAGGFDDAFANGFEDVDLCLRLGEQGYEVHYCHESVVYHLEMGTRDFRDELPNYALYRRRWAHKVRPEAASLYIEDDLLSVRFNVRYPFSMKVSPRLALIEGEEREREADRLLASRADQVAELMRENLQLRMLLTEAGLEPPAMHLTPPSQRRPSSPKAALFVSDAYGDPMRYRCDHHVEELDFLGATADSGWLHLLPLGEMVDSYSCFVLHRVPRDEHIEAFMKAVQGRRKPVIFDTDDLLFDPGGDTRVLDLVSIPESERPVYEDRIRRHSQTMTAADAVFVTTEQLAAFARELNPRVFVIPNAADEEMLRLGDQAIETHKKREGHEVRLAYLSGSPTHDLDFLEAADGILWALDDNPAVRFVVVGNLELDSRFARYGDRIERLPILPWRRLPSVLAGVDVNLAPLEGDNPFTESKSCIKWIEAGLVAVPTIASPRADFLRAVRTGSTGLFADTPDEWREALGELIASPDRRQSIGQAAYDEVRRAHTTTVLAPLLHEALAEVTRRKITRRKLKINWLAAPSGAGRRGEQDETRLARELASRGHQVRLFGAEPAAKGADGAVDVQRMPDGPLPPADVAVSSGPETARIAVEASSALFKVCLVQSRGDAMSLDRLGLRYVCVGEEAAAALKNGQRRNAVVLAQPLEAEALEPVLLDLCFARLDPDYKQASA
jgi:GT2 family glycosyltransferase